MTFKKGDKVIVIAGKGKGTKSTISGVFGDRVLVEGVAKVKRHQKSKGKGVPGGIIEIESLIHASNVMHVDPKGGKQTRVGSKVEGDKKVRVAKKSGQTL